MKKLIIIFLAVLLAGVMFFVSQKFFVKQNNNTNKPPPPIQTSFNFLVLGYAGGTHDGTYLTDTIMLAHVDTKTKKVILFSIPRDLWVRLPTKSGEDFHTKINSLYMHELYPKDYPDIIPDNLTKKITNQVTGLKIDGYVSVNFAGFTKAIDILGGIDVDVKRSFTDPEYPIEGKEKDLCDKDIEELFTKAQPFITPGYNPEERNRQFKDNPKLEEFVKNATDSPELAFPCRYEKLEFVKGRTHMDGVTALKYARSRHSPEDGGDFARALRQQQVIEAVKNKVISLGFVTKIIPLLDEFKKDVKTDISLELIKKLIPLANQSDKYIVTTYVISDENLLQNAVSADRQYILIPKEGMDVWSGIRKGINNIIEGITPTLTATSSAKIK